jgi:two-component system cell cycle sensor histidine kinase/response regulator CckA
MNRSGLDMIEADSLEQVKGQCVYPLIAEEHLQAYQESIKAVFRGESQTLEFRMVGLKGRILWLYSHNVPLRNEKDEIIYALATTIDITERKQAEKALTLERDRFKKYLDVTGVMLLAINADRKVILINNKGCEILGYNHEEIIGKNWFDNFLPERLRKEVEEVFDKLVTKEEASEYVEHFENPVLTKNGEERLIAWHNNVLYDEQGKFIYVLTSGEDITDLKQAEADKSELEAQLQQSQKLESLGVLAGGIAHDFNNILTAILGNISIAKLHLNPDDASFGNLTEAEKASIHATKLTHQLLYQYYLELLASLNQQ